MKYKITVSNTSYNDTFLGVKFEKGIGFTDNDKTARYMEQTYGYKVEKLEEEIEKKTSKKKAK